VNSIDLKKEEANRRSDLRAHYFAASKGVTVVCLFTAAWSISLAILCLYRNRLYVYDDVFITLRYARHLMNGLGPRWNRAGVPVEGFTSPLHMLLIAALGKTGLSLMTAARLVGFSAHVLLVCFLFWFVGTTIQPIAGTLAAALMTSSWPILVWDLGGLDEVLFASLLTIGILMTLRYIDSGLLSHLLIGGGLLGLAGLTRPEASWMAAVSLAACLALGPNTIRQRFRHILLSGCIALAIVVPWEIFRLVYFHAPLPNTYYAKVYGIPLGWRIRSGIEYWLIYARKPPYLAVIGFLVAIAVLLRRSAAPFDVGLWACILGYAVYVVTAGGDHMMAFRFMIPLLPLLAVSLVRGLVQLGFLEAPLSAVIVSVLLFVFSVLQVRPTVENPIWPDSAGVIGEYVARYINGHWPAGSWIAINTAGSTAYFADEMNYIDMLGLNDRAIALRRPVPLYSDTVRRVGHMKGDGASVLSRRPDFIIASLPWGDVLHIGVPYYLTEYELVRNPEFAKLYKACVAPLPTPAELSNIYPEIPARLNLTFYQRRDLQLPCTHAE